MKKRLLVILPAAALLLAAALMLFAGVRRTADLPPIQARAGRGFVRAQLSYDDQLNRIFGTQTIAAVNPGPGALSGAWLRLEMNGAQADCVRVSGVTVDDISVQPSPDREDATLVFLPFAWAAGQEVRIRFTVSIKPGQAAGAFILPALCALEEGAWRLDPWDALADAGYAQAFDYQLQMTAPRGTAAAFGGALTAQRADGGSVTYDAQLQDARDVSFYLLPGGSVRSAEASGVLLTAVGETGAQAARLLSRAKEALGDLEGLGLAGAYPALSVAPGQADTALSGLVLTADTGDAEQQRRRMTALVARQTFGVLVKNDPWNAPWLSHAVASAAEMLCYRARRGAAAYETRLFEEMDIAARLTRPAGVCVGAGTAQFGSAVEMAQVLGDQGAAMLLYIGEAAGTDALRSALAAYAGQCAGGMGTQAALEAALLESTGSDWHGYLEDELAY